MRKIQNFDRINFFDFFLKKIQKKVDNLHTSQIRFVLFCSIVSERTQQVSATTLFRNNNMIKTSKIDPIEVELEGYTADRIINDIKQTMKKWKEYDFKNDVLWKIFQNEFENYTEKIFNLISKILLSVFRLFLRKRNVWILLNRKISVATILANTFKEKESIRWTNEKMNACHEKKRFTSN